jgi:hypothetical protein
MFRTLEAEKLKFPVGDYRPNLGKAFKDVLPGVIAKNDGGKRATSLYYVGLALNLDGRREFVLKTLQPLRKIIRS